MSEFALSLLVGRIIVGAALTDVCGDSNGRRTVSDEFMGICVRGHRSYLRLVGVSEGNYGRCTTCGDIARLLKLPPVVAAGSSSETEEP